MVVSARATSILFYLCGTILLNEWLFHSILVYSMYRGHSSLFESIVNYYVFHMLIQLHGNIVTRTTDSMFHSLVSRTINFPLILLSSDIKTLMLVCNNKKQHPSITSVFLASNTDFPSCEEDDCSHNLTFRIQRIFNVSCIWMKMKQVRKLQVSFLCLLPG